MFICSIEILCVLKLLKKDRGDGCAQDVKVIGNQRRVSGTERAQARHPGRFGFGLNERNLRLTANNEQHHCKD
jgi:hypothetical protein